MDVALSEDGKKLFTSYVYVDGVEVKNGLAAYNFGSVGQNENSDRLMGGYKFADTIIPKVEFLDNNTVCAYRDWETDRKSTRLNSSHSGESRMPSSA